MFRLKGAILTMSFLDCNGVLIPSVSEQWRDNIGKEKEKQTYSKFCVIVYCVLSSGEITSAKRKRNKRIVSSVSLFPC